MEYFSHIVEKQICTECKANAEVRYIAKGNNLYKACAECGHEVLHATMTYSTSTQLLKDNE